MAVFPGPAWSADAAGERKYVLSARARPDRRRCVLHPAGAPLPAAGPGKRSASGTAGTGRGRRVARLRESREAASPRRLPPGAQGAPPATHAKTRRPGPRRSRQPAGDRRPGRGVASALPRSPAPRRRLTPCRWKPSAPPAGCSALTPRPMAAAPLGIRVHSRCAYPGRPGATSTDSLSRRSILAPCDVKRFAPPTPDTDAPSNRLAAPFPRTVTPATARPDRVPGPCLGNPAPHRPTRPGLGAASGPR